MKTQMSFRIGLVKPVKELIVGRTIKATDRAWREAIFGFGGSRKRIGGIKLGTIEGQPLALLAELQSEISLDDRHARAWTIKATDCLYGLIGPAAVYNDVGYGPASIGISIDRLKELVNFDPDVEEMRAALARTLELRKAAQ